VPFSLEVLPFLLQDYIFRFLVFMNSYKLLCGLVTHGIAYLILHALPFACSLSTHHTDYIFFCLIAFMNLVLMIVTFLCRSHGMRVVSNIHSKFRVPVEVGQIQTYMDLPY
jgi:hypothetical protein